MDDELELRRAVDEAMRPATANLMAAIGELVNSPLWTHVADQLGAAAREQQRLIPPDPLVSSNSPTY